MFLSPPREISSFRSGPPSERLNPLPKIQTVRLVESAILQQYQNVWVVSQSQCTFRVSRRPLPGLGRHLAKAVSAELRQSEVSCGECVRFV
jgi:hypothetical protein